MNSLRWKLIVGTLSGMTLLIGVGGTAAYFNIRERLYAEFDRGLIQRAVMLSSMIDDEAGVIKFEWLNGTNAPPGHQPGIDYLAVWRKGTGEVVAAAPEMADLNLPRFGGSLASPQLRSVELPGNFPGRCAGLEFNLHRDLREEDEEKHEPSNDVVNDAEGTVLQLVVGRVDTVAPSLAAIQRPLIGLWAGCTILGGLIIWLVVRQSLRPLDHLTAQIGSLEDGMSGQRIALSRQPDELKPVTDELNRLLERVEKALVRERTLTSNVAHELRTPIAGLLCTLEVALNRLRSPEEYRESTEECFEIAKRMHWLVNNLLSITRIEAGNVQLQNDLVTIEESLREWWKPFAARAKDSGLQVEWDISPGARLQTDPEFLRVVVTNLFDNAVSYTPEGGTIHIETSAKAAISVANKTVDLKAEVVEHVFDPFWRNSESNDGVNTHAGLGLNLCKKIIELLGGRISARIQESDSVFVVRVELA